MTKRELFKQKYGIDPLQLVEDVNLKYVEIVKKIGLQRLIDQYVEEKFDFKTDKEFYILLVESFLEAKEKFPQGQKIVVAEYKDEEFVFDNIPLYPSIPSEKDVVGSFKNIVSKYKTRPAMTGVYVDADGFLVGTDAHKMVVYKNEEYKKYAGKVINLDTYLKAKGKAINLIDDRYPDYKVVLPNSVENVLENQDTYAWYNYVKSVSVIVKYLEDTSVNCHIKMPDDEIYAFNSVLFSELLEFFISKGYKKFTLQYYSPTRGIVLDFGDSLGLLMPIRVSEMQGTKTINAKEIEKLFAPLPKKSAKKKSTTSQNKPDEDEPDVPYKRYEGSVTDTTYIPRRDIRYLMLKSGEKLSSADIIDGVYRVKNKMARGGITFDDKVKVIKSSLLKRKKVSPKVQKDYGKTYSPKEAEESARRIVGAMTAKERLMAKMKKRKK